MRQRPALFFFASAASLSACSLLSDVDGQGYSSGARAGASGGPGLAGAAGSAAGKAGSGQGGAGSGGAPAGSGGAGSPTAGSAGKPAPAVCGDGVVAGDEECDGDSPLCQQCKAVCPQGTLRRLEPGLGYRCYGVTVQTQAPWDNAREICRKAPGCDLATLSTAAEFNEVRAFAGSQGLTDVWLGASFARGAWGSLPAFASVDLRPWIFGPSVNSLVSVPGDESPKIPAGPQWDNPPDAQNIPDLCVSLNDGGTPGLVSRACSAKRLPLCECVVPGRPCDHDGQIDPGEECDDGNSSSGDGCSASCEVECSADQGIDAAFKDPASGRCFLFDNNARSWAQAEAFCQGHKAHLARVVAAADLALVLAGLSGQGSFSAWVDGTDAKNSGSWLSQDGSPLSIAAGQIPWAPGQPDKQNDASCIGLEPFDGNVIDPIGLAANACNQARASLCERLPAGNKP